MARPENGATPLGLTVAMNAIPPGSCCCGNPGPVDETPLA